MVAIGDVVGIAEFCGDYIAGLKHQGHVGDGFARVAGVDAAAEKIGLLKPVNVAVLIPMPRASARTAAAVKPKLRRRTAHAIAEILEDGLREQGEIDFADAFAPLCGGSRNGVGLRGGRRWEACRGRRSTARAWRDGS